MPKMSLLIAMGIGLFAKVFAQDYAPGSIMWHFNRAKTHHQASVQLPLPEILDAEVENVRSAATQSAVVIADLLDEVARYDTYQIYTLSKYKIREHLNGYFIIREDNPEEVIPHQFLPLAPDEFVLVEPGGTIRLQDVTRSMLDGRLNPLPRSEPRLMFLQFYAHGRMAALVFGHRGMFTVMSDGTLRAALNTLDNDLKMDLDKSYGSSVSRLIRKTRCVSGLLAQGAAPLL